MKTRLLKEARQLLPAWLAALSLAFLPVLLLSPGHGFPGLVELAAFMVGLAGLSVASFGHEFDQRTFAMYVVQPASRERLWREKVSVLAAGIVTATCVFVSIVLFHNTSGMLQKWRALFAVYAALGALAAFGGGLFLTLALRQVLAASVLTILLPGGLLGVVYLLSEKLRPGDNGMFLVIFSQIVLFAYAVLMYGLARILFLKAQDTQWTGGNVALPGALKWLPWIRTATTFRATHPLRALCRKEFQFQQVSFLLAGLLFVFQIAILSLSKLVTIPEDSTFGKMIEGIWALWFVLPLLVGCAAVAEERKLGTLEPQLCLPVSRVRQFAVKTVVTLVCGLALGALLPWLAALAAWCLGLLPPTASFAASTLTSEEAQGWLLVCAGITLISLYASTLTRQLLNAFGTTIVMIALVPSLAGLFELVLTRLFGDEGQRLLAYFPLFFLLGPLVALIFVMAHTWSRLRWLWTGLLGALLLTLLLGRVEWLNDRNNGFQGFKIFGLRLMQHQSLAFLLGVTPFALLLLVLAYRNFRHTQISRNLWLRNARTWVAWLLTTAVVTTLIYHRPWELVMPFEPPPGPPRLSGPVRPVLACTDINNPAFVLLPDGRLCSFKEYECVPLPIAQTTTNQSPTPESTWREIKNPRAEFIGGSNWVSIALTYRELIGVKSDGSLWSAYWSEWVDPAGRAEPRRSFSVKPKESTVRHTNVKLVRIGSDSDWMTVASGYAYLVALKRDSTIWGWGDNQQKQLGEGPAEFTNAPVRISPDSDWAAVFASSGHTIAVKRDGSIWKWERSSNASEPQQVEKDGPIRLNLQVSGVRRVICRGTFVLILDTDGNLWRLLRTTPKELAGPNWADVALTDWPRTIAGFKNDGSLWDEGRNDGYGRSHAPSARLGNRTDWLAVALEQNSVLALAKDGTVCRFGEPFWSELEYLLAPTRRVTWSLNILDSMK